jgi:hypothetical protein
MPGSRGDSFIPEPSGCQIVFRDFTGLNLTGLDFLYQGI